MKCEVCQELLEEYLDGELSAGEQEQINAHLITCADCSASFSMLTAEQELFSRYDRELEVPPFLWTRIAQHTVAAENSIKRGWRERLGLFAAPSFVGAVAILLIAIALGVVYFIKDPTLPRDGTDPTQARNNQLTPDPNQGGATASNTDPNQVGAKASPPDPNQAGATASATDPNQAGAKASNTDPNQGGVEASATDPNQTKPKTIGTDPNADQHRNSNLAWAGSVPPRGSVGSISTPRRNVRPTVRTTIVQSDVLSSDLGYLGIEDRETAKHIEKTQNLLRSIRNVQVSDSDEEIDVTYDKALSRRLLNENVVLRRDAEMKAKFPTKSLLADVEPFLIDIANLPDHARPEDVRVIKERVQKTEIVAALMGFQDRSPNNR